MNTHRKLKIGMKVVSVEEVRQTPPRGTSQSIQIMSTDPKNLTADGVASKEKLIRSARGFVTRRLVGTVACISGDLVAVRRSDGTIEHASYGSCEIQGYQPNDDKDGQKTPASDGLPDL